ncbi:hypothetical protein I316_01120 [Kwoniella heveanensis BCC8398]|uniref:Galactose oxidase n=1 Tax=Kwoniella heveanensis BCC8398 TaxID=1296120 RepID=A0A1B9H1R6_9TREE|nr:hypothetical protein I316_01120 [Kwoniella heveanensis BCC8398]
MSRARRKGHPTWASHITSHGHAMALLVLLSSVHNARAEEASSVEPRWGHAAAFLSSPPTLIVQGGKTDPSSSYTYSSSPNTGETLILPFSSGFSTSSPPFTSLDTPSAPTSAWHSLTPLAGDNGKWQLLSFGGDGGTSQAVQTGVDSAWNMDVTPAGPKVDFTREPAGGGQPMRRIYHSATSASDGGKVYITGGLKADGSGSTFSEAYAYDSSSSTFSALPNLPVGLYHHTSLLLPNGTLLAMGGAFTSPATGTSVLQPYSTIYSLDTTANAPLWEERSMVGKVPEGRRGATMSLSDDGSKAFLFGGADAALGQVYGDGWEFDLSNSQWKQTTSGTQGAGPRYDHIAMPIGGDQVAVFGGYADGQPADSKLHLWDTKTQAWLDNFNPAAATSSSSASAPSASASGTASDSSPTTISSPTDAGAHSHPLTTPIRVGLILGILAFLATVLGLCLWRNRRRRRQRQQALNASWPANGPRGRMASGQYGLRPSNSDDDAFMEKLVDGKREDNAEHDFWNAKEKGASIGLGMGAIGASLASISSKLAGRHQRIGDNDDPYAELRDVPAHSQEKDEQDLGGPLRKSSRKVGKGIRLLGPRPQREKSLYYSPEKSVRTASIVRESRLDMLREEDSPHYAIGRATRGARDGDEDWVIPSDESDSKWKSAKSILNQHDTDDEEENPFEGGDDYDDDAPVLPPLVKGGPVPTPHDSRSDLGTFDEIASMSNPYSELSRNLYSDVSGNRLSINSHEPSLDYHLPSLSPSDPLDLAGLLPPPDAHRYSQSSFPTSHRSGRSGQSNALSDAEEGVIHQAAHLHSQSPTLVPPGSPESAYVPIKRSESFFRRMAAGGIPSLLPSRTSSVNKKELDIRDPAPQPTLWPIMSQDNLNSPLEQRYASPISPSTDNSHHPPTSWKAGVLQPPQPAHSHGQGPSLSSLTSVRSMRDMIIVQREATDSTVESQGVIGRSETDSPPPTRDFDPSTPEFNPSDDVPSSLQSDGSIARPEGAGHHRLANGLTTGPSLESSDMIGSETPGEIIFNGAEFASPVEAEGAAITVMDFGPTQTPEPAVLPFPNLAKQADLPTRQPADSLRDSTHASSEKPTPEPIERSLKPVPVTPKAQPQNSSSLNTSVIDSPSNPPSGSPVPSPLVQHRRPVREVVNSINKRGGSTPFSLLSPMSNYSPALPANPRKVSSNATGTMNDDPFASPLDVDATPRKTSFTPRSAAGQLAQARLRPSTIHDSPTAPAASSDTADVASRRERVIPPTTGMRLNSRQRQSSAAGQARPKTMWEVIKREEGLRVANPDQGRSGRSTSSSGNSGSGSS